MTGTGWPTEVVGVRCSKPRRLRGAPFPIPSQTAAQPDRQVVPERVERPRRDRHDALLVPLPAHEHPPLPQIEVADGEPGELLPAEPAPVPERDEGGVAPALLRQPARPAAAAWDGGTPR